MGKKVKEASPLSEPEALETKTRDKKKSKKEKTHKRSNIGEQNDPNIKQKLEETELEESNIKDKKKKEKKKKHKKEREDGKESEICERKEELNSENGKTGDVGNDGEETVVVTGKNSEETKYTPLKLFKDSKLPENVLACCKDFKRPSPIQAHAWPFLLDGRDFIGIAKTGSGKTLAFGVPGIMHVLSKRKDKTSRRVNPLCLVMSPTRELADQISNVLCDAGEPCGVKSVCLYGGTSKQPQIAALKSGVDIVIGTAGRLKDLIEMNICNLSEVSFVVLDEADRMLDLGFEPEVRFILSKTCSARQMVMFSATWPTDVHRLAQDFMDPNPVKVVIGSEDLSANHDVMQIVEVLDERSRFERLVALLEKYHKSQRNRVLVFVLYKEEAKRIEPMLQKRGWTAVSIHGDKPQYERTKALSLFKKGSCPLMVATDVAARGLDIPDVEVVINYSFPLTTEDYVHRIGRTGRAGRKGVAHTFFTDLNKNLAGELVNVLREAGQIVPAALMKFGTHVKKKESKLYGSHFREISSDAPKAKKIRFDNSDDE
ncbi:DEAD-box ATP-dependent RNA helicase 5 isoform X1 [Tripterygium wilfordii]|uniref:RNA helicase n=1 Tax=Tripterygium wilfordii TaxID=458696 RepID=A0A7J7C6J4_TRIWF|nr:DEAD-box ATP-dependent RNA helicase 5-like [Tripterygium wilfordii]KAF5729750.1 DEAD-box ATP-dependent RNA helicase 5 isoform X1 [Tripterygium wilfordii]